MWNRKYLLGAALLAGSWAPSQLAAQSVTNPVNFVSAVAYDPVHYSCAVGITLQLRDGYNVYDIDGGGALGTCTIKLPVNPSDSQFVRLAIGTNFTLMTVLVQTSTGSAVDGGTVGVVTGPATPQWQMQAGTFRKIGS